MNNEKRYGIKKDLNDTPRGEKKYLKWKFHQEDVSGDWKMQRKGVMNLKSQATTINQVEAQRENKAADKTEPSSALAEQCQDISDSCIWSSPRKGRQFMGYTTSEEFVGIRNFPDSMKIVHW